MGLNDSLEDYENKQLLINTKMSPTTLRLNTKNLQGIFPMEIFAPWDDSYFKKLNKSSKILPPNLDGNSFNKCNVRTKQFKTLTKNNFPDVGLNNQLNLFMSYSLSSDSIWTHHAIEMP